MSDPEQIRSLARKRLAKGLPLSEAQYKQIEKDRLCPNMVASFHLYIDGLCIQCGKREPGQ